MPQSHRGAEDAQRTGGSGPQKRHRVGHRHRQSSILLVSAVPITIGHTASMLDASVLVMSLEEHGRWERRWQPKHCDYATCPGVTHAARGTEPENPHCRRSSCGVSGRCWRHGVACQRSSTAADATGLSGVGANAVLADAENAFVCLWIAAAIVGAV